MIRTFLEFLLSQSLDARNRPAGWLRRRVQRDAQLKQFDSTARQLDSLLRRSAAERRQAMAAQLGATDSGAAHNGSALLSLPPARQDAGTSVPVKTLQPSAAWLGSLAAAAVVLLVVLPGWLPHWAPGWPHSTTPAVHAGEFSQQLTVVPGEVLRLITRAAETSRTQLPQLSPLAQLTLPTLPAWEDVAVHAGSPLFEEPLLREIDTWQESWRNFKSRLAAPPQEL